MVVGAAAKAVLSHTPSFEEGGVERAVHHLAVAFLAAVQSEGGLSHDEAGIRDIFLHIGACPLFLFKDAFDGCILGRIGQSGHHRQGLHTVVRGSLIGRMAIGLSVPAGIEAHLQALHLLAEVPGLGAMLQQVGHAGGTVQGNIVPGCIDEADVAVVAPVAPVPGSMTLGREAARFQFPDGQVAAHMGISPLDEVLVARIHVISPHALQTDGGQHLARQFGLIDAGDGAVDGVVGLLVAAQLQQALAHDAMRTGVERIEALGHEQGAVAPPLGTLALGTVEIGVAHVHIQGAHALLPIAVEEGVVAMETAHHLGVVARLAVGHTAHRHAMGHGHIEPVAVHPAQALIGLLSRTGDIFGTYAPLSVGAHADMVGVDANGVAALGVVHRDDRRELDVIGEMHHQCVGSVTGMALGLGTDHAKVLPQWDGPLHQFVPGSITGLSALSRGSKALLHLSRLPRTQVEPSVIAQARLAEPVVGLRVATGAIGGMDAAHPGGIRHQAHLRGGEEQTALLAALVGEAALAEVPQQQGHLVAPLAEIGTQVHTVEIGVLGRRAALELPLKHHLTAVYPEPVLGVGRYAGHHLLGHTVDGHVLAEGYPRIGRIGIPL